VRLANRAAYSSIARHQCGSVRAVRTEGTGEASEGVVVVSAAGISRSMGRRTPASGGRARGHSEWRPGGTHTARSGLLGRLGPRTWSARGGDRRRRVRQSEPRSSMGPSQGRRGSGVPEAVVDEGGIGEASHPRRRGRVCHKCGAGMVDEAARGTGGVDGATRGASGVNGATCGAGGVDVAARGTGRGTSGGVEVARGAGNSARRGAWGGGGTGLDSRRESRSVGGEEPARRNTSSSKTT
jgi:hypothetical protein